MHGFLFRNRAGTAGFTFLELLIVVAIIGILAAIALPSYNQYVLRGKRVEGRSHLVDAAAILERYYSDNSRYTNDLAKAKILTSTETGKYDISIASTPPFLNYTLTATANFDDPQCGNLTLTQAGTKGVTGTGTVPDCWSK